MILNEHCVTVIDFVSRKVRLYIKSKCIEFFKNM